MKTIIVNSFKSTPIRILRFFFYSSIFLFAFSSCTNQDMPKGHDPFTTTTTVGINVTIPGTNFINSTTGSINLYSLSLPSASFTSESVKCELNEGLYVMTMVSPSSNLAYTRLYFINQPIATKNYNLVAYDFDNSVLNDTTAGVIITIIKDNKSWRSKSGSLKVTVSDSTISARIDTAYVECTSNITDTTYYMMIGDLFCQ